MLLLTPDGKDGISDAEQMPRKTIFRRKPEGPERAPRKVRFGIYDIRNMSDPV